MIGWASPFVPGCIATGTAGVEVGSVFGKPTVIGDKKLLSVALQHGKVVIGHQPRASLRMCVFLAVGLMR